MGPMAEIAKYLEKLKHSDLLDLLPEQMQALLQQVAIHGVVTRHRFADLLQHYLSCVKEISITADFEVKADGSERKLAVGEVVKVEDCFEESGTGKPSQLQRSLA